ncbi:MAG: hypothetical protein GKS02_02090 [Alphaproteobacteria bacterium]|nr:hypothetical protein [Alphaproteobacteria bacterium]
MPNTDTFSAPLWAKMAAMPALSGGLLTEAHRRGLVAACQRDLHDDLIATLPEYNKASAGGLILPESEFDDLMDHNKRVKNHGPIYRQTLWALYRDMLDRDATYLFWRMYYCNRKGPEWVDGKPEFVKQNRCHSLFCPLCRKDKQRSRQVRAKKRFGDLPMGRLYFLTVLYKCATDLDNIKLDVEGFKGKMEREFKKAGHLAPVEMQGAMEIDLKHPWLYEVATKNGDKDYRKHCAEALGAMGVHLNQPSCPERFWLIHYHAIVDVGRNSPDEIKKVLKSAFAGSHRVRLEAFHPISKTPMATSLDKLAAYPIKSKLQYGVNIYADNPYRDNKTCYGKAYSSDDMAYLCRVVDDGGNLELVKFDIGGRGGGDEFPV